jgi:hypothetical protein
MVRVMKELEQARKAADGAIELATGIEDAADDTELIGKLLARNAVAVDRAAAALEVLGKRVVQIEERIRYDDEVARGVRASSSPRPPIGEQPDQSD